VASSDVRRIKGKGGRLVKALERKYGVEIDVSAQNADGNLVISGGNEAIRQTVEADIRDRMIMTISLPFVNPIVYAKIKALVDDGKLQIVHQTIESENRSICFNGLAK
jgi:dihydrofolate reductase